MKKLLLFFLLFQGFCLSAQNIILNGDFSSYNLHNGLYCPIPGPNTGFVFSYWDQTQGFFHFCNSSSIRFRDRDTLWVPGGEIMPMPRIGDGYSAIRLMYSNFYDHFHIPTPYISFVAQALSESLVKDTAYVFEFYIRPFTANRIITRQFSIGFIDYIWQVGSPIDSPRLTDSLITLDSFPASDQWTHVRYDFIASGDEKMLILHGDNNDTTLASIVQNPMPPPPGHTFHNEITRRAHFLIDDVHLYKASDTIFHVDIGNDTLLCDGAHLDITATPEGFKLEDTVTTWMWSTGDTTPTIRVHDPGTYWVEVRINHTYWARDTIVVEYEEFPEWPKPFGDVLEQCNDVGSSWEEISGPELKHGGMYFWSTGSDDYRDNWWDGTHNGEPLPMGVYTYRIVAPLEGRDSFDRVGTVTIVK